MTTACALACRLVVPALLFIPQCIAQHILSLVITGWVDGWSDPHAGLACIWQAVDMAEPAWQQHAATASGASPYSQSRSSATEGQAGLHGWTAAHDMRPSSDCYSAMADEQHGAWQPGSWEQQQQQQQRRRGPPAELWGQDGDAAAVMDHQVFCFRPDGAPAEYLGWGRIDKPPRPAAPTFGCSSRGPPPSAPCHGR